MGFFFLVSRNGFDFNQMNKKKKKSTVAFLMTVSALHLFLLRNLCQFLCYAHPPVDAALKTEWMSSVRLGFGEFWIPESDKKKKTKKNVKREKKG